MTDQPNSVDINARFVIDRNTLAQFQQSLTSARSNLVSLGGEAAKSTEQFKQLNSISAQIGREQSIQQMGRDYAQLGKLIKDDTKALEDMHAAMKGVGSSAEDINKAAEAFKSFQQAQGGGFSMSTAIRSGATGIGLAQNIAQGDIGGIVRDLARLKTELSSFASAAPEAATGFAAIAAEMGPIVLIAAPLVAALVGVKAIFDEIKKSADDAVAAEQRKFALEQAALEQEKQNRQAVRSESSKDVKQSTEDLFKDIDNLTKAIIAKKKDIDANAKAYSDLGASFNPGERNKLGALGQTLKTELDTLEQQQKEAVNKSQNILQNVKPGVENKEATEAAKGSIKFYWDTVKAQQEKSATEAAKEAAQLKAEQDRKDKETVSVLTKRDADIKTIEERGAQSRIDLQARTADKIAQITQQALDAADASLQKLKDKLADLTTNLVRGTEDAETKAQRADIELQIKGQEKDRDTLVAHLRKVEEIRKSFDASERDAIYDRNFDQLFRLQENKAEQLKAEDKASADAKKDREQASTDERNQLARQRQYESQDRLRAYQRALQDAQQQYQRELIQQQQAETIAIQRANDAARVELSNLNNKIAADIALRRQAAVAELAIVNQTEEQKRQIFYRYLNEYRAMMGQSLAVYQNPNVEGTAGGTTYGRRDIASGSRMFAGGGNPPVGVPSFVNEPRTSSGRETFTAGGKTVRLPGFGLFTPLTQGTVNANATNSTSNNVVININGNDTAAMRREVISALRQVMK